ncbi:MAG TPA: hypothetical protein VGJ93_12490 [Desulfuromonadaceae bacterium]|jgi:chemotaxis protein CheD
MEAGLHFSKRTYFDRTFNVLTVKILPGEYHVTDKDIMISTVLGSCVSICVYDRINRVGGMNHFMLPGDKVKLGRMADPTARYGTHAMKLLFEHFSKLGGKRESMEVKVFGAGKVIDGMGDIGRQNAEFALQYLKTRNIRIVAVDVGDVYPRRVYFSSHTGQAFVKKINNHIVS